MSKEIGAKCGHVKRRLLRNEPLTGKVLEFALEVLGDVSGDKYLSEVPGKLKAGQPLSEYECHLMVDVILLHVRLGSSRRLSSGS